MAESGRAFAKIAGRKDVILVKMLLLKFFWNIGSCSDQNMDTVAKDLKFMTISVCWKSCFLRC